MSYQVVSNEDVPIAVVQHERQTQSTRRSVYPVTGLQEVNQINHRRGIGHVAGDDNDAVIAAGQEQRVVENERGQRLLVDVKIKLYWVH